MTNLICEDEKRREDVRASHFNGLDYLEVDDAQTKLTVFFLGKAPEDMQLENIRLTGGRRVRDVKVVDFELVHAPEADQDDQLLVWVDKPGDFSTYTLCLVALDKQGHPTGEPLPGFDPRYFCLDFSFKAGCSSDLDCKTPEGCPPEPRPAPEINYLAKDYASFRQLLLDRLSLLIPDWKERHVPDLGIALVELLAYTGDYLSYYQDAVATEAYLNTARQRISVRRHARLVDYRMHEGCNARAWVTLETDTEQELAPKAFYLITGKALSLPGQVLSLDDLAFIPASHYEVFAPLTADPAQKIHIYPAHNRMAFYTWGDGSEGGECCLPKGATSATLKDAWEPEPESENPYTQTAYEKPAPPPQARKRMLRLQPGDVLIFEEVFGPRTGNPADAAPSHRHAKRMTRDTPDIDPLYDQPVLEIEWAEEDALPFPLCLSTIGDPPACKPLEGVSVARGNVILVDHGRAVEEDLGCVPFDHTEEECPTPCHPPESRAIPGRFRPVLKVTDLVFSQPLPGRSSAHGLFHQNPRLALPKAHLLNTAAPPHQPADKPTNEQTDQSTPQPTSWLPQYDLLASGPDDLHFVVEMDDARRAHLRFGNGEMGKQPEANSCFTASYRVGVALAGNVGAKTISHIVFRHLVSGVDIRPENPLPAVGGTAPEPVEEVKLFAPHAFRHHLERAILPEDYAAIVLRDFPHKVQRAAAILRWMGSWYEVLVVIDPLGTDTADPELLQEIAGHLYRYRRIGHDLSVQPARYAPLDVEMRVCVQPGFVRGHVKAALLNTFSNRMPPDGKPGFFHPDALTFGEGVHLSRLVAAAQAVQGVESVEVTRLQRLFEPPNGEIENGLLPLGPLEIARLDNDPGFPENGQLTLIMEGGR